MRTKLFLIAAISVTSLLLVTAGLALAKGKPDKKPVYYTITTFADGSDDAIQGDVPGPYGYRDSVVTVGNSGAGWFIFRPRHRKIYYNISDCASGNCPEIGEGLALARFDIRPYPGNDGSFLDMAPGEEWDIKVRIELNPSKKLTYHLVNPYYPELASASVQALDTDNIVGVDRWIFTIPAEESFTGYYHDGVFHVPFTFTMDLY